MTEPKKYRTHWTIEQAFSGPGVQWYKHQIDMDNVHYCPTVEEAEREIDDAIIMEQEQVIDKFRDALLESTSMLLKGTFTVGAVLVLKQIRENNRIIKAFQP